MHGRLPGLLVSVAALVGYGCTPPVAAVDMGAPADIALAAYPAGPYGSAVGATVANLFWLGYPDEAASAPAISLPYANYSMNSLRATGRPWALVHLSDFFGPGAKGAATALVARGKSIVDAGGAVAEVLAARALLPAAKADLDAWLLTYPFSVTTVADPVGAPHQTVEALGAPERSFIIDLATMKIVWTASGPADGVGPSSAERGIDEILALLGNKGG